jgi:hypothetical protein
MQQPSVAVVMPCFRSMEPATVFSLMGVVLGGGELVGSFDMQPGLYVDAARNELARDSLRHTHTLWLDDDMEWPSDLLQRLLAHGKPVVGANYFRKEPPYDTAAGNFAASDVLEVVPLERLPAGLAKVDCLGMGATLVENQVFRNMRGRFGDELYFRSDQMGEDVWFFNRLRQMGVPAYLDCSIVCGHRTGRTVTEKDWQAHHRKVGGCQSKSPLVGGLSLGGGIGNAGA